MFIIKITGVLGGFFIGVVLMVIAIYALLYLTPLEVIKYCAFALATAFTGYFIPIIAKRTIAKQKGKGS